MNDTFTSCNSLIEAPRIPKLVKQMYFTFQGCSSLTGNLVIDSLNLEYFGDCFKWTATGENCNLVVSGTCPRLDDIIATKSENSHITRGN